MRFLSPSNFIAAIAAGILGAMQLWGAYREYWWFDNVAHFLGGVALGGFLTSEDRGTIETVGLSLGVSTLWEIFEFQQGIRPFTPDTPTDTMAEDTLLDKIMLGAGAYLMARWFP